MKIDWFCQQICLRPSEITICIYEDHAERKVRITQNKEKESENSYRKLKSSQWTGTQTHTQKQN